VIVAVRAREQPFASVMVHVYVPATRPVAVAVFCTGEELHEYESGAVPPLAATVALPVLLPKQSTLVCEVTDPLIAEAGCVMVTFNTTVQLFASFTMQV
jgi:hypothetical protein